MTASRRIPLQVRASAGERSALAKAAELMTSRLEAVDGATWAVDCVFLRPDQPFDRSSGPAVLVTSLLDEVDKTEPWAETAARLRSYYQSLFDQGHEVVFVSTVFRHVGEGLAPAQTAARRARIRRLNMLAVELSQSLGLFVMDLDRDLADVGARALATDYRLGGPYAPAAAGKSMAMAMLLVGLDEFVPFELQEAARERLRAYQPDLAQSGSVKPRMVGPLVVTVRSGARRQVVESTIDTVDESFIAMHIRRLTKGQISLGDAAQLLMGAVRRQGWRSSFGRLLRGLRSAAGGLDPVKR